MASGRFWLVHNQGACSVRVAPIARFHSGDRGLFLDVGQPVNKSTK